MATLQTQEVVSRSGRIRSETSTPSKLKPLLTESFVSTWLFDAKVWGVVLGNSDASPLMRAHVFVSCCWQSVWLGDSFNKTTLRRRKHLYPDLCRHFTNSTARSNRRLVLERNPKASFSYCRVCVWVDLIHFLLVWCQNKPGKLMVPWKHPSFSEHGTGSCRGGRDLRGFGLGGEAGDGPRWPGWLGARLPGSVDREQDISYIVADWV